MRFSDWISDVCSSDLSVPYQPKPCRRFDVLSLGYFVLVAIFLLGLLGVCQYAALVKFWPYDLSLSLTNYAFDLMDGGGWDSYYNSIQMALLTAVVGTVVVFVGAYVVEKTRGFRSEEHTSDLQSLMRISYAVFCLKKKKN